MVTEKNCSCCLVVQQKNVNKGIMFEKNWWGVETVEEKNTGTSGGLCRRCRYRLSGSERSVVDIWAIGRPEDVVGIGNFDALALVMVVSVGVDGGSCWCQ